MGLWDKVQKEIDRAGNAAKDALDEGKLRIELFRVRQNADKAAQALGYAVHRAKRDGKDLDEATFERLHGNLKEREAEAKSLEEQLAKVLHKDAPAPAAEPEPASAGDSSTGSGGPDSSAS
ncbi:MAG: hypothetical protein KF709_00160 [Gemmatimonadaceae bacterium]|nr:hypothetical protein [Gemmatimonadaceae bacterium]